MSGIAGILYPDVFQINHLTALILKAQSHRGSYSDIYTYKNLELGVCGCKIASDSKKNIYAAIDGNIFNLSQLRKDLEKIGYVFTDQEESAEALVFAYDAWGEEFLTRLDGEFALFLFDRQQEWVYIARDRIGNKPLYWYQEGYNFIFASELKGILATGMVPQTPALDGFAAYLTLGYFPQDMTPIQKVNKLLPGHFLRFSLHSSKLIHPYWSYSSYFTFSTMDNSALTASKLDRLLQSSIAMRAPEGVPLGTFISGGLGSASIAYYLKRLRSEQPLHAYSAGFQGQNEEDLQAALTIARKLHLPHELDILTPKNFLEDFVKIIWHLDEPLADPNILATWQLGRLAHAKSKIVFSGMGSDELLAGHSRYTLGERNLPFTTLLAQTAYPLIQYIISPLISFISPRLGYKLLLESRTNPWQSGYLQSNALFDENMIQAAAPTLSGLFDLDILLHKFHHLSRIKSIVSSFLYFDVKTRLPDLFMLQYERLTAAFGLDWRTPFLSAPIVEYLAGFTEPENLQERDTASALKIILRDVFPPEVTNRPKRTRRQFLRPWVELSDLPYLFGLLSRGTLVEAGIVDPGWIENHNANPDKRRAAFPYLWAILALEVWYRLYINYPPLMTPPEITLKELLEKT